MLHAEREALGGVRGGPVGRPKVLGTEPEDGRPVFHEVHGRRAQERGDEGVRRLAVHLRRRADLPDAALVQDRDPVPHRHRLDLVVRDVDRGRSDRLLEVFELLARARPQLRVQVGERLIQEKDRGLAHERPGERDPLPFAPGELARLALQQRLDPEHRGRPRDLALVLVPRQALRLQREGDVLEDGQVGVERVGLEDHRDAALARGEPVDDHAPDQDLPRARLLQPRDHPQHRRLARARRPEQHEELPLAAGDVHAVHGGRARAGIDLGQRPGFDDGH